MKWNQEESQISVFTVVYFLAIESQTQKHFDRVRTVKIFLFYAYKDYVFI